MQLRRRALEFLRSRLAPDRLSLRLTFWDGESFDFSEAPRVTITLHSPALLRSLLRGDFGRLGDAYASGELAVDGGVDDILRVGITLAERLGKSFLLASLTNAMRRIPVRHSRKIAKRNGSHPWWIGASW